MGKKYCLFCDEFVTVQTQGDYDRFTGCHCAPDSSYSLLRESYETINAYSHGTKRQMFPIISAYIREQTDCGHKVTLSSEDLEALTNSPTIPFTLEEKGHRFLQFLFRHTGGPQEPVIVPLTHNFNLTYSPNIQELVFIIDKLQSEQCIIREGMTFKLTEQGWREAAARAGGRILKSCIILISGNNAVSMEWTDKVLPKLEQCGYSPRLVNVMDTKEDPCTMELIAECKLIVADLTGQAPEVYFAAGYALGRNIPVLWTLNNRDQDTLRMPSSEIRPILWDTSEELAMLLQQKLIQ